jgi:hypothetical protein
MMRSEPRPKRPPRLVPFFPSSRSSEERILQNVHMFVEDIGRVMPVGSRRKPTFRVTLQGDESAQNMALKVLDALTEHPGGTAEEKLSKAVDTLAKRIAWEGRAQFELIPRDDGAMHFHAVTSKKLYKLFGFAIQFLGTEDRKVWRGRPIRWAPKSVLWHVDVPKKLGGRGGYRRILSHLGSFDNLGPRFWAEDMWKGNDLNSIDFKPYALSSNIYRYQVTGAWGWNGRDFSNNQATEFYSMYRGAESELAKSIFREHIISSVNALLKRLNVDCSITVDGLPLPSTVKQWMRDLLTGDLSFRSFLDLKYGKS